ncbi:hypothetical protein ACFWXK_13435 [Streptomyces sp. NPDC059070]|uniref:hypothetical protein n=1 Tax=unclassified Streptomyces TaxID=2593676 RepID=UPI0034E2BBE0
MEQSWVTEEYGASHEGRVGVLLADGSVPGPVLLDDGGAGADGRGRPVDHWSVYDGRLAGVPRAAVLRAVCACGWTGPEAALDWAAIGRTSLWEAALEDAGRCLRDWDGHILAVGATTVPLPETVTALLEQLETEIEKLTHDCPVAGVKAARQMEIVAARVGYWAACDTEWDMTDQQTAAALGLSPDAARKLLARFGGWSPDR